MKSFLTACGLTDSLQVVVESQSAAEGELRLLHQPFAVIGRDPRADVVLDHTQVSRRHVYLQVVDSRAFWVDLDSRTGTRGDGQSQKSGWLEGGQTLCVGPYVIRRFVGDSQTNNEPTQAKLPRDVPLVALAQNHVPLAEVALDFLNGPSQSMAWPVRRMMSLIGSASGCKFRLTDASVSRFHGSLLRTSAGLWIVDLLGQGGITVNKVPVHFSHLADGDVLRIGRYQIRVRCRPLCRGSDNGLADHARAKPVARPPGRERVSSGFMFPDWGAATAQFKPKTEVANVTPQFPLAIQAVSSSPRVEFMASEPAFPLKLAPSELTESMLVPLANQFGLMQQQMFDQFQQAMAMMVQMFGTMHRDQMEVIRAELDQLHDLTEEFHALKNELANRMQEQGKTAASGPAIASVGLDRSAVTEPNASVGAPASERLSKMPPLSKPLAAQPRSEAFREPDPRLQARTNVASPPADAERGSIVWLHQRILTLQRERESRWQKILKLLPGMS
jgi:pSer/pThr/pTyr-binding forkhead associated (FHA) protein